MSRSPTADLAPLIKLLHAGVPPDRAAAELSRILAIWTAELEEDSEQLQERLSGMAEQMTVEIDEMHEGIAEASDKGEPTLRRILATHEVVLDFVWGSGNVFRDLGHPDTDREQLRSLLAARVIGVLNERKLTVREAHELTGFAAADFSRIRQAKLDRFTIDRLMSILARLGQQMEVAVNVHPQRTATHWAQEKL